MFMLGLRHASHSASHRPSSPAYRDWLDYAIVEDGRDVGRIYQDRHSKPETAVVLVDLRLRQSHARRMPTLWRGFRSAS